MASRWSRCVRGLAVDVLFINGPASQLNYLRGFCDLRRALQGHAYDLVHAHYVFSGVIALSQRALPVILTHHGIEAQQGWTAPLCRLTSARAACTIATSSHVAAGLGAKRLDILPCGVDTNLFSPMDKAEARAPWVSRSGSHWCCLPARPGRKNACR